jgi:hypothetical protein
MKITSVGAAVAVLLLAACGHDHSTSGMTSMPPPSNPPPSSPPPSSTTSVTTSQLLTEAQQTSETAAPFVVNDGAFTITDSSDTTAPITVSTN